MPDRLCLNCGVQICVSGSMCEVCKEAFDIVRAIQMLRAGDGESVTILCDNENGTPNNAVDACGEWTGWMSARSKGNTLLEALNAAANAKRAFEAKKGAA